MVVTLEPGVVWAGFQLRILANGDEFGGVLRSLWNPEFLAREPTRNIMQRGTSPREVLLGDT